jgi:hypothetical protein
MEGRNCEEPLAHVKETLGKANNKQPSRLASVLSQLAKKASDPAVVGAGAEQTKT